MPLCEKDPLLLPCPPDTEGFLDKTFSLTIVKKGRLMAY